MPNLDRLLLACERARRDLLASRVPAGHWIGELSSSALSTATAISALAIVERHLPTTREGWFVDEALQRRISELIVGGLRWLAGCQNPDGGWGDTDRSLSNIATTMLVRAAFQLTGCPADPPGLLERADAYIESQGGVAGLKKRYGKDKTFAVPILTNCALAGLVPWKVVSPLPFELACLPQSWYRFLRLPVVSYAIPALVAIGQARFEHAPPWNPLVRNLRRASQAKSLKVLEQMQPESGGFLEATPLTSFVVMSLASIGQTDHPVTKKGLEFLLASARDDGAWPIDTNLATWVTTLSLNALGGPGDEPGEREACLDWLLSCQHRETHPYTGAAPGGWGWSDLSGAVPDADDTPGALLALSKWFDADTLPDDVLEGATRARIDDAARWGVSWLLDLQNSDGGWPTFCRGWGLLPFDRSGTDLTAHVLRALLSWRERLTAANGATSSPALDRARIDTAIRRGFRFLRLAQRSDGSWLPLWFGNQHERDDENPLYGTARVLLAYRDAGKINSSPARRGLSWLAARQNGDGGWGGGPILCEKGLTQVRSSVEETALAVEALLSAPGQPARDLAVSEGLEWLLSAVEAGRHRDSSPIGFYFAKLWYYEALYPLIFTVSALGRALSRQTSPEPCPASSASPREPQPAAFESTTVELGQR